MVKSSFRQIASLKTKLIWRLFVACLLLALGPVSSYASRNAIEPSKTINFTHLTVDDGLSQGNVYRVLQDHIGFIWIATQDGLNRFDGKQFITFRHGVNDPDSISGNDVRVLFEDSAQRLWIGTQGNGLNLYDQQAQSFEKFVFDQQGQSPQNNVIIEIIEGKGGILWLGTRGGLVRFDPQQKTSQAFSVSSKPTFEISHQVRDLIWLSEEELLLATGLGLKRFNIQDQQLSEFLGQSSLASHNLAHLEMDSRGSIWIGSLGGGLFRYDPSTTQLTQTDLTLENERLGRIRSLYLDRNGMLWVGTRDKGLYYFDEENGRFSGFRFQAGDPTSLSYNNILSIYQDRSGLFWAGTWGHGISLFDLNKQSFRNFLSIPYYSNSLRGQNVWAIIRSRNGDYWFGTNDGGLNHFSLANRKFSTYWETEPGKQTPVNQGAISDQRVWSLGEREDGLIWIGTYFNGLKLLDPVTGRNVLNAHLDLSQSGLEIPRSVLAMLKSSDGSWWFATRSQGLARLAPGESKFTFYRPQDGMAHSLPATKIFAVFEDSQGRLWVGTEKNGLSLFDWKNQTFTTFQHRASEQSSLLSNVVLSIGEDHLGRILVGTESGLSIMQKDHQFVHITTEDGLGNGAINGILRGCDGRIWLATNKGLAAIDIEGRIVNFGKRDGLVTDEFNTTAFSYGPGCELLFGGINGAVSFVPQKSIKNITPKIVLTGVSKYYQPLALAHDLESLDNIELSYKDKVISFTYALLDYYNPERHQFMYRLTEDDKPSEWFSLGRQNQVNLNNLSPGKYLLEMKGQTEEGVWSEASRLKLNVMPPLWRSMPAYISYALALLIVIFLYLYWQRSRLEKQKALAEKERLVAVKLRRLDKLKDEFLANTSHELRTPLNAIIGLSNIILDEGAKNYSDEDITDYLTIIRNSSDHLLHLVNDILDYSALKENKIRIEFEAVNLKPIVESLVLEMRLLSNDESVIITSELAEGLPRVKADPLRLYQILLNLLSNANKFTKKGHICVTAKVDDNRLKIVVSDTGKGIKKSKQEKIFSRFEQAESSSRREFGGAGLGLAITKELVELHHGTISVHSEIGKGSQFEVELPIWQANSPSQEIANNH